MAELVQNLGSFVPDNLIVDGSVPILTKAVKLGAGQGILKRGTVLGKITVSGQYKIVNSTNVDGSQDADCILADDVDTATSVVAVAYTSGHFNRKALVFGGSDTADTHEARLRELGIFLSDNVSY